ncbi:MAG: cyclic nucleotide-binding domain-containing protein [Alphaproteobacteria bacterium]
MGSGTSILERSVIQEGKVFIRAGDEISRAYVIQNGEVCAYTTQDEHKVEVAHFGPGAIIGELGLVTDEISALNYEALTLCTMVTITRQEFQKRLSRADKNIATIMEHAVRKISFFENLETQKALKAAEIDQTAYLLMNSLLKGIPAEKRLEYEDAVLPHLNGLIKSIKDFKKTKSKLTTDQEETDGNTQENAEETTENSAQAKESQATEEKTNT